MEVYAILFISCHASPCDFLHTDIIRRPRRSCWEDEINITEHWIFFSRWAMLVLLNIMYTRWPTVLHLMFWMMRKACSSLLLYFSPHLTDSPAPLVSSDKSVSVPVEASIEDLRDIQSQPSVGSVQTDARGNNTPSALNDKLQRELLYHKHGSYNCDHQPEPVNSFHRNSSNPFLPYNCSTSEREAMQPEEDKPPGSSVHSWTKAEPEQSTSQETWCRPTSGLYQSMNSTESAATSFPMSTSSPSLDQFNQEQPHSNFNRQKSWPVYPVTDTSAPGRLMQPDQGTKWGVSSSHVFTASTVPFDIWSVFALCSF